MTSAIAETLNQQAETAAVVEQQSYSSYSEILQAQDPSAAFEEIAGDPVKVEGFLRDAEYQVAATATELKLGLHLDKEEEALHESLGKYEGFLGLVLAHDISSQRGLLTDGQIKNQAIEKLLKSLESILTIENDLRLEGSSIERGKEKVAASKVGQKMGDWALIGAGVAVTWIGVKYGVDLLPHASLELIRESGPNPQLIAGATAGVAGHTGFRYIGDKLTERAQRSLDERKRVGKTETGRVLYEEHQKQIEASKNKLYVLVGSQYFGEEVHSEDMVTGMLSVVHNSIVEAYEAEDGLKKGIASGAGTALATGAFTVLLGNERVGEQLGDQVGAQFSAH